MIKLGSEVRDATSGFRGVAYVRMVRPNGNVRLSVSPPVGEDNVMRDSYDIDQHLLEVIGEGVSHLAKPVVETDVELLDEVYDRITGFSGAVTERYEHLTGCVEFVVESAEINAIGTPIAVRFDAGRLIVESKATVPAEQPKESGSFRSKSVR